MDTIVSCDYCKKVFNNKICLKSHMRWRHVYDEIKCKICGKISQNAAKNCLHLKSHNKSTKYECDICGKFYWQKRYLLLHMKELHIEMGQTCYICDKCGSTFQRPLAYKNHIQKVCKTHRRADSSSAKIEHCYICQKTYVDIQAIRLHYRRKHTPDELKSICLTCNTRFPNEIEVLEHRKHDGIKFKCKQCPFVTFKCEFVYRKHLKSHAAINELYTCDVSQICNTFTNLYKLHFLSRFVASFCLQREQ